MTPSKPATGADSGDGPGGRQGRLAAWVAPTGQQQLLKGGLCRTLQGRLSDGREVVVKRCQYRAEIEADGLGAMAAAGAPVPAVLGCGETS